MTKLPHAKKKKLRKISALKKQAWRVFSEWIRRREADKDGYLSCITCGTKVHWKDSNASHFLHGHSKPTFFEPRNVHGSCIRCNLYLSGNLIEYTRFMIDRYGLAVVDELRALSKQIYKPSRQDLEAIIEKYSKGE